jgi:hypothetical protein
MMLKALQVAWLMVREHRASSWLPYLVLRQHSLLMEPS